MKKCPSCYKTLSLNSFNKRQASKDGLARICKECNKAVCKRWQENNKDYIKEHRKVYYEENKEKIAEINKQWKLRNKLKVALYVKEWKENNVERYRELKKKHKRKLRNTPEYKIHHSFSERIRLTLKGQKKNSTFKLLGYNIQQLKEHLESNFQEGMTWNNYGFGVDKWTIDHIIPVSHFNFTSSECEDFKLCWALENLQPMWFLDNCKKGNREPIIKANS